MERTEPIIYVNEHEGFKLNPKFYLTSMEKNSKMLIHDNPENWRNEEAICEIFKDEDGKILITGQVFDIENEEELDAAESYIKDQLL